MTSKTPAAIPAASNVVSLKTLAEHDCDLLRLLVLRLGETSVAALARLQTRPKKLKIAALEIQTFPVDYVATSEAERLQWLVYQHLGFLGSLAQALKKRQLTKSRRKRVAK